MKPKLRLPFKGDYPITFPFGAKPASAELQQKFREWGIVGHHGVDFGLPEGTKVVASAAGKVIRVGEEGDFGIVVIIAHPWGQSIYAHLKESTIQIGDLVKTGTPIGLSGKTGVGLGEHLHFGIKLNDANPNNGYLGFTDPSPFFLPSYRSKQL